MAKKIIESDFEDMKQEKLDYDFGEHEFDDVDIDADKNGKGSKAGHFIFFAIVVFVLIILGISLWKWNQGEKIIIDPDEDTSEFDTEPNDYIQPLTNDLLSEKEDDGILTILALGNAPFADNGEDNYLVKAFEEKTGANVINGSIEDSIQTRKKPIGDESEIYDAFSLYNCALALTTGDFSLMDERAANLDGNIQRGVAALKNTDMTKVDCLVICYDISDYVALSNVYNPADDADINTFCGSLYAACELIQEKYPYIRIVVMSPFASGKTIDGNYYDAATFNLSNGVITDYIGQEVATCATRGVSYLDLFFGAINVENKDDYLENDYHLNEAGAEVVANRFASKIQLQ